MGRAKIHKAVRQVSADTTFCYSIRGGTCKNLVSASNNYICAAGHGVVAETRAIDSNMLKQAKSPILQERIELASSSYAPAEVIGSMVKDLSNKVRAAALQNPNCPKEAVFSCRNDQEESIRRAVAKSMHCDEALCEQYLKDEDPLVRLNAISNPNVGLAHLQRYASSGSEAEKSAVASNPNCPPDLQMALSSNPSLAIRQALVDNPSACPEALFAIMNSGDKRLIAQIPNDKPIATLARIFPMLPEEAHEPTLERLIEIKNNTLLRGGEVDLHRALTVACYEKMDQKTKSAMLEKVMTMYQNDQDVVSFLFKNF